MHNKTFPNGNRLAELCCDFDISTYGTIIFTKEFAETYWTGKRIGNISEEKYRLREMSTEKNKVKYIERFL